ncbi:MAG: hypothetical protein WD772_07705, partial [Pseudohongiellaceae bacterium]
MTPTTVRHRVLPGLGAILLGLCLTPVNAQDKEPPDIKKLIIGTWLVNEALSQNTDDQVEAAIKSAGGKVERRWFGRRAEDYYRGGPAEHELYDRMSYDDVLTIDFNDPEFRFGYEDNYQRVFFTDGRTRSTGVSDYFREGGVDYSFASWEADTLLVEARPRDGGFTEEIYSLEAEGTRLRAVLYIEPQNFGAPIELIR